jgi:hypothetical protein
MGGNPYWYFVPYERDIQHALDALRAREFSAGRYNPVVRRPRFDGEFVARTGRGAKHASIGEAIDAAGEEGTRSILDISSVDRKQGYGVAAPVSAVRLREWFGTDRPSHSMLANTDELFESLERGQCVYVIVYEADQPSELFFAGYSYD